MDFTTVESLTEYAVRRYLDMLMRLAYQRTLNFADAEDITQEVFLRLSSRSPGEFNNEEHLRAWLIRVTLNMCCDHARRRFRHGTVELPEDIPVSDDFGRVMEEIAALPPAYRDAVYLFYYENMSTAEIGALMGKSEANIQKMLSRARGKLREMLTDGGIR